MYDVHRIENTFQFLNDNRWYNHRLQEQFYLKTLVGARAAFGDENKKLISNLLFVAAQTQSQVDMDALSETLQCLDEAPEDSFLDFYSFGNFLEQNMLEREVEEQEWLDAPWAKLGSTAKSLPGMGQKTGALFAKYLYHCHEDSYDESLRIFDQSPRLEEEDGLLLPVDRVIFNVFSHLRINPNGAKPTFTNINRFLRGNELGQGIMSEVWDDLWFWGFITQRGSGNNRQFGFNRNKYLCLEFADRTEAVLDELNGLANKFLECSGIAGV